MPINIFSQKKKDVLPETTNSLSRMLLKVKLTFRIFYKKSNFLLYFLKSFKKHGINPRFLKELLFY